jgi:hypothetical protein
VAREFVGRYLGIGRLSPEQTKTLPRYRGTRAALLTPNEVENRVDPG